MTAQKIRTALACTLLACATLAPIAAPAPAEAAGLALRPVVEAHKVTLGDLFVGLEADKAALEVAPAPEPGRRQVYDMPTLMRLAQAHKLDWRPMTRKDHVVITRAHKEVGTTPMMEEISLELDRIAPGEEWEVSLDNPAATMVLAPDANSSVGLNRFQINPNTGRFLAELQAPAVGQPEATISLSGRAHKLVNIPVLSNSLRKGDIIAEQNIAFQSIRESRIPRAAVLEAGDLIGMAAERYLRAGQPLTAQQIGYPVTVRKGDVVTILYKTSSMVLSSRGKALEDGSIGDMIRVSNTSSRRLIDAEVTGPEMVRVGADELAALSR